MRHIAFRIISGLVLLAAIAGIALLAYNAGVSHGVALNAQTASGQTVGQPYPAYGMPFWWPFPFFGFGFLGLLALLFLLAVAFGSARRMMWGPGFGWHRMHGRYGPWGEKGFEGGIPPMFAELHRRMHAAEGDKPADQATQKQE